MYDIVLYVLSQIWLIAKASNENYNYTQLQ